MITGAMPWSAEQQVRMAWGLVQNTAPAAIAAYRPGVPAELEALVERSLAWKASERPTAQEMAEALERMADSLDDGPADVVQSLPAAEPAPTMQTLPPAEAEAVPDWWRVTGAR
jgi:hypothetical protein